MLKAIQLGANSGLRVSELCLGTMNFGEPGKGHQGDWTLGIDEARSIFKAAIDHGLYYFDCADTYGVGACERVVGQLRQQCAVDPGGVDASVRLGVEQVPVSLRGLRNDIRQLLTPSSALRALGCHLPRLLHLLEHQT